MLEARGFPKEQYAGSESFSLGGGTAEEVLAKRCATNWFPHSRDRYLYNCLSHDVAKTPGIMSHSRDNVRGHDVPISLSANLISRT